MCNNIEEYDTLYDTIWICLMLQDKSTEHRIRLTFQCSYILHHVIVTK